MSELYFKRKVMLFKLEGTYGVDPTPSGAVNAVPCIDVSIQPMQGQDVDRGIDFATLGNSKTIPADLHMALSFKVELVGSGTAGVAPAWGPILRACGCAETIVAGTSVIYNPVSDGFESAWSELNIDGLRFAVRGGRGNAKFVMSASGVPQIEVTLTGLWTKPSNAAAPTPDLSNWPDPKVVSAANTPSYVIAGQERDARNFSLDLGNQVEPRFMMTSEQIVIADRSEMIETQVVATPLSDLDPYALAQDATALALSVTHGTVPGTVSTLAMPSAQMQRPDAPTEAQGLMEWPLKLAPLPVSGNDQWTLTLT